ncbi:unnamed protein product [Cochlearia groenlandica]
MRVKRPAFLLVSSIALSKAWEIDIPRTENRGKETYFPHRRVSMRSSPVVLKKFEGKMDSEGNRLTYRMKQTAAKAVPLEESFGKGSLTIKHLCPIYTNYSRSPRQRTARVFRSKKNRSIWGWGNCIVQPCLPLLSFTFPMRDRHILHSLQASALARPRDMSAGRTEPRLTTKMERAKRSVSFDLLFPPVPAFLLWKNSGQSQGKGALQTGNATSRRDYLGNKLGMLGYTNPKETLLHSRL